MAPVTITKIFNPNEFQGKIAGFVDLIGEKLGGKIISYSDDWFASADNLIKPDDPIKKILFIKTGAWMDGWESRRHNTPNYDWCIIKLGVTSAKLIGCEVDTAHFTGNAAPAISVEATNVTDESQLENAKWETVIPKLDCNPDSRNFFLRDVLTNASYSHVKLNMHPDGGIARFRLYGTPTAVFPQDLNTELDLAHVSNGGVAISSSDQHYGGANDLLMNGRGIDISQGWQTARSRGGDHKDWVIVKLGASGHIDRVNVDTAHFIGNFPQYVTLHGLKADSSETKISPDDPRWKSIVPKSKMGPDAEHFFESKQLDNSRSDVFTHVKYSMIPDGGTKRLRTYGRRASKL